jgi:hypothetical protein
MCFICLNACCFIIQSGCYISAKFVNQKSGVTDTLLMLKDEKEKNKQKFATHQHVVKIWFEKHKSKDKNLNGGELVLKWDNVNEPKEKHSKF